MSGDASWRNDSSKDEIGDSMIKPDSRWLEFFYFDAGGGHRSAAMALREVITERYPDCLSISLICKIS